MKSNAKEGFESQRCNSKPPPSVDICIQDLIHKQCISQPEAPAVDAWNGQLTYAELDTLSSSFGAHLANHGVGPEVFVPLCVERSSWVPVAMCAILKAGGAFVLLDSSHPFQRMKEVCSSVKSMMIVTSKANAAKVTQLGLHVILIDDMATWSKEKTALKSKVKPSNAAYAMFTSGTTGKPKGAVLEHRSYSTSALAHSSATNMHSGSRVLHFASYAFDGAIIEILTTLIVGGCVCIPKEVDRNHDLAGASRKLRVTWAILTPSLTRVLEVHGFPTLKTLVFGGEAVQVEDIEKWSSYVELFQGYGPTECAVVTMVRKHEVGDVDIDATNLGRGVGVSCWVVNPDDHNQLCPAGMTGELLLDGPSVGRGYINDPVRTAATFISAPAWHKEIWPDATAMLYKTGDLVKYSDKDGSIRYVSRKDTQVKMNGQRMELGEVETHVRRLFDGIRNVVVELVTLTDQPSSKVLIAFILADSQTEPNGKDMEDSESSKSGGSSTESGQEWILSPSEHFQANTQFVRTKLQNLVPGYMVPMVFLPLRSMPLMPSGKSDRRQLRFLAAQLTRQELEEYKGAEASSTKEQPSTHMERVIQRLWAEVLQISIKAIGRHDSFLRTGGDSMAAIKLAGVARRQGLTLTVGNIYNHETLAEMAAATSNQVLDSADVVPFSLLSEPDGRNAMCTLATRQCQLRKPDEIEDVYPCTPLQEGLMALTAKRPGAYTVAVEYELPADLDASRFQKAWDEVANANPVLRTRIIQAGSGSMYQVVVSGSLPWEYFHGQGPDRTKWQDWKLGGRLARFYMSQPETSTELSRFIIVLHHALTDGWAVPLLLQQVEAAYKGKSLARRPFNAFIKYISQNREQNEAFWRTQFAGLNVAVFPAVPSRGYVPNPTTKLRCMLRSHSSAGVFTIANKMKLAWAILVSLYTESPDVVFGAISTGRGAPVLGVEEMTAPTIAAIPVRLRLNFDSTITEALSHVQETFIATIPFEQSGLQHIKRMSPEAEAACLFQSLLVIQPGEGSLPSMFTNSRDLSELNAFSTYGITLICQPSGNSTEVEATFDPELVGDVQMGRILHQLQHIFQQLTSAQSDLLLRDIDRISSQEWSELTLWNGDITAPVYSCAHELIQKQCKTQPNAPAVCAWDGEFTYSELDELSSDLAVYLIDQGVGPGVFVPLCFEKSRWTTVAMQAVSKAGGAFILLDASHPAIRLQGICEDAKAPFVISSETNATLAGSIAQRSIILGDHNIPPSRHQNASSPVLPNFNPENPLYAVFTSGSTGKPKGAVISHISWCTSAEANRIGLFLDNSSRVFQFASYAFDISIADNLLTLVAGGCICVASEEDRQGNMVDSINTLGANWACITPSVARIIAPKKVPALKTLVLCGEPIVAEDILLWSPHTTHLLNLYGPAECAILSALNRDVRDPKDPNNVGKPTSAVGWIVDANENLAPIGTIGELLVESPIVGYGYLNDPEITASSFIPAEKYPTWLARFRPEGVDRLYRTGDLVQYTANGSFRYIGRKDTQMKLRGQRIELSEVEHQLRRCFPGIKTAIAEVVVPTAKGSRPILMAFIELEPEVLRITDERFNAKTAQALEELESSLPKYMVPTVFIPLNSVPLSKSGKVDRKLLRSLGAEHSSEQKNATTSPVHAKKLPSTDVQRHLLGLFAEVIKISADEIGMDSNFFRLGGDSIVGMNLVARGRDEGLLFTVADIFENPTIVSLAEKAKRHAASSDTETSPFALIKDGPDLAEVIECVISQCQVEKEQIEDVYPCTPLQEGLMALAIKMPGMYIARFSYMIPENIDLERFKRAWSAVCTANPILRTRMIQSTKCGTLQAILSQPPHWETYNSASEERNHAETRAMDLGQPLMHLALIQSPKKGYQFIWTIHHALYDGWSLPLLWTQVKEAYEHQILKAQPFNRFIQYLTNVDGGDEFWTSQLSNLQAAVFPPLAHSDYTPNPSHSFTHTIAGLPGRNEEYTISSVLQLAWAVVLAHYTDSDDIVFGLTVNGRTVPMAGISKVTGPTIATVPLRVRLSQENTIKATLSDLQRQGTKMIPFLQHGLQNIRKLSADAAKACEFQTQLVIQPSGILEEETQGWLRKAEEEEQIQGYEDFASYAFAMFCHINDDSSDIQITVTFDSSVLQDGGARRLVEQFETVASQLLAKPREAIRNIQVASAQDLTQLAGWNGQVPSATQETLHNLILYQTNHQPESEAVCAWDGNLTYRDLDDYSGRLAQHLVNMGIPNESRVAVCLEKSRWSIVSLLAVLRASATCVLMDAGHPRQRIQQIMKKSEPQLLLASQANGGVVQGLGEKVVLTGEKFILSLPLLSSILPRVLPSQAAFILFTSGSTGTPKGVIMEHVNLATSILAHSEALSLSSSARSLHFASYAFDISIYEVFSTLVCGGAVCIPSEHDRMNNLARTISQLKVNWAFLTPSTLSLFDPEHVPSLKILALGGEAVTREVVDKWASKLTLINAYGPAEGTCCTAGTISPKGWRTGTIGKMLGSVAWITSPSDSSKLAAIGSVGELIIEGPVVTKGYLNEPEKTTAAYMNKPAWLQRFRVKGVSSRLYKTGDLVQYNQDGTLRYIGRKDTQVKVRGQRIELEEVDYHVRNCFPTTAEVITEIAVPKPDGSPPMLVACIWLNKETSVPSDTPASDEVKKLFVLPDESFCIASREAETRLLSSIPSYMVPGLFLQLREVPMTPNGKVDRRRLREVCGLLMTGQLQQYIGRTKMVKRAPSNSTEHALHGIWARVLNRQPESFGVDDSFFRLGGDSISAMQVVAHSTAAGLKSSVAAIFQAKTIAQISNRTQQIQDATEWKVEKLNVPYDLSPIQQLFLKTAGDNYQHFNQSLFFRLAHYDQTQAHELESAIRRVVARHSMLRARFSYQSASAGWKQTITDNIDDSYLFQTHCIPSLDSAAASVILSNQRTLDIENGPLLVCDLFQVDQNGQLFLSLVAHHLVVDTVSWQIILADLEAYLTTETTPRAPALPFQTWSHLLSEHTAANLSPAKALPNYTHTPLDDYWGLNGKPNTWGDASEEVFSLSEQVTQNLLGRANNAFQTQPVELLHAAILQSFRQTFTDRPVPVIFNEGHGRESWDPDMDLTRTVGWFSTFWPSEVQVEPGDDILDAVRKVKDGRRQVAANGWKYFASRYLHRDGIAAYGTTDPMEISFNYHPGLPQDSASLLQYFPITKGELSNMPTKMPRFALVDVMADVSGTCLSFTFIFNRFMRHQPMIRKWIQNCKACLEFTASFLVQQATTFTLSDFPLLKYSYHELDAFVDQIVSPLNIDALEVEDAYPCTPVQEGMLLSQAKDPLQYFNRWYLGFHSRNGSAVDPSRLLRAWQQVLHRHPLLRTVFYANLSQSGSQGQLVLKQAPQDAYAIIPTNAVEPIKLLMGHRLPAIADLRPQNRLTICGASSGEAVCLLEISHTVVDGISRQILLRDLRMAYDGKLDPTPQLGYREYVEWIKAQNLNNSRAYWDDYLKLAEPCFLSKSPARQQVGVVDERRELHFTLSSQHLLRDFCSKFELTMANVFQLGWALVLRTYLNEVDACFGYMSSGRDAPIPDIDNTVGPFINMLVCFISPREGEHVLDLLRRTQAEFVLSLTHQHLSLAEKMKGVRQSGTVLFNTVMSVQKEIDYPSDASTLEFKDLGGDNPNEYDLSVNIGLLKNDNIDIALEYTTAFLSDEQAHNLGGAFQQALSSTMSGPQSSVTDLNIFGTLSRKRVADYNAQAPLPVEECIHDLIHKRCIAQPSAPAICAWDGDFTYAQLDKLSAVLAVELMQRGVGPDFFVPLCFEKSRWTPVALLAVIKSGGTFVLLDPSYPLARLQSICQETNSSLILASPNNEGLAATLGQDVIVVGDESSLWRNETTTIIPSRTFEPSNGLFVVFTSGSTGKPKGFVIEHRSFATFVRAHIAAHQLNTNSRVLQFASYAFDVSIMEHLSTLIAGGCICVASASQREDDFASVVANYKVNWAFLTPAMCRIMDPSKFKTLKTLLIGGDAITSKELALWRSHVDFYLCYGPSETSIMCSTTKPVTAEMNDGRNLGHVFACNAWIVSPENHDELLPVGAVGELLIEGPIVARGYLNDPIRTAAAFISAPKWRSSFPNTGSNPFYKSGDLVRYTDGGELQFVARKDFMVKLRGQRIELSEVEQHLSSAFPAASDAIAEIVTPAGGHPTLVAFVCVAREGAAEKAESKRNTLKEKMLLKADEQFFLTAQAAEQELSKTVPAFMVPACFFPLRYVPRTTNNKTDRRQLREAVMSLTSDDLEAYNSLGGSKQQPSTEGELLLQQVWARVLNKSLKSIGVHDSFFRLGGDSISAMQVASQSSSGGMSITVADIFRCKTISQLNLVTKRGIPAIHVPEITNAPFSLSPIQKLFFQVSPQGHNHFNQDFSVRLTRLVSSEKVADAIHHLVRNHSMLRARFAQDSNGTWMQTIREDTAGSYHYQGHSTASLEAADSIFSSNEKMLDITNGPILTVNLFNIGDEQYLFLAAHHLVVDLVSWRVILGDLEDYFTTGTISTPPSLPFQTWCRLQEEYAVTNLDPEKDMLRNGAPKAPFGDYWGIAGKSNLLRDVARGGFVLDGPTTSSLLGEANEAMQTQPLELFQAAILHSFSEIFRDRPTPAIWNEGHGREPWASNIDVSRTVGWFTTLWPLYIPSTTSGLSDVVRQTKDTRRNVPRNGWAHFASSLHPKAQELCQNDEKEILFNYLGQYQQLERSDSLFQAAVRPGTSEIAGDMERFALLEISVSLKDSRLHIDFLYNKYAAQNRPIHEWIVSCEQSLKSLALELPSQPRKFTLSDFPLIPSTYYTLEAFVTSKLPKYNISSTEVEDMYPCSPIQRGILLSQAKDDKLYQSQIIWKVRAHGSSLPIDLGRVIDAWRLVIARHTILRTVFVKSASDADLVDQVVLKSTPADVCEIPSETEVSLLRHFSEQRQLRFAPGKLPYLFSVAQTLAGDVLCSLEINHAIFDGTTKQILLHEFQLAYEENVPSAPPVPYQEYIAYLSSISESSNKAYWATYLDGVAPCLFPTMASISQDVEYHDMRSISVDVGSASNLRSLCDGHHLTLSNLFQVAWGLVLKAYVGSDSICFGYLNSGRDIPIPNVEHAMGPFISMLISHMTLPGTALLIDTMRANQAAYIDGMEHQHYALTDMIRLANLPAGGSLFNTAMSLQVTRESDKESPSSVSVEVVGGEDPAEYDLTVNIVVGVDRIDVSLTYWKSTLAEETVQNIADTFRQAIHAICTNIEGPISDVRMLGQTGRKTLQAWNQNIPTPVHSRLEDLIHRRCLTMADMPAVCSWDGDFTYRKIDDLSSKLAVYLGQYDIRPDSFVPICFEKSRWTTIAMLAVVKAGGAFCLLDPSQPSQRLLEICELADATVIISSERQSKMAATFAESIVVVGDSENRWADNFSKTSQIDTSKVTVSQEDALFAVFTSGSTGKPKGVIITHRAFITSATVHSRALHLDETSRVLQFASYAFDASVAENFTTLIVGGTVCVPSDIERNELPGAVARMGVNWAFFTPSMARILNPADLPSLRVVIVGGELISQQDLQAWRNSVDLYLAYGPSECSVFCAATEKVSSTTSGRNLGFSFGCRSWIVDQHNHLAPIGAIGELLIEGPNVARGYLKNPEKTKESFIQSPPWLEELPGGKSYPVYKTGDLVKYNQDGSLYYISRKDTQVKLRGQRLELGEVEHHGMVPFFP
ncbi:Nonribosomal peptide synthetase [Lachnellula suecica]|uniref:Nonribosomal peptide synthetase n=1 Tax=Lachnellula suecica TaxID=602035 RepID=A0A8T9CQP2_9HELO|nr:Nonribosomal peptide synthetase [Lachnellula suecica]